MEDTCRTSTNTKRGKIYTMQATAEATGNNGESGTSKRTITAQTNRTKKQWNSRQLARLKYWHHMVQEDQIGQIWFDI